LAIEQNSIVLVAVLFVANAVNARTGYDLSRLPPALHLRALLFWDAMLRHST
jgi:hypothetical protein